MFIVKIETKEKDLTFNAKQIITHKIKNDVVALSFDVVDRYVAANIYNHNGEELYRKTDNWFIHDGILSEASLVYIMTSSGKTIDKYFISAKDNEHLLLDSSILYGESIFIQPGYKIECPECELTAAICCNPCKVKNVTNFKGYLEYSTSPCKDGKHVHAKVAGHHIKRMLKNHTYLAHNYLEFRDKQ